MERKRAMRQEKEEVMLRTGIVGYGHMGSAIAGHLVNAGYPVAVVDTSSEQQDMARAAGIDVVADVSELAELCDVALILVGSESVVRELIDDHGPFSAPGDRKTVVCVVSTVDPMILRQPRSLANEGRLVDAPVCRALEAAVEGTLLGLLAGNDEAVSIVKPVFQSFCSDIWQVSDRLGDAQVVKTVNNVMLWGDFMVTEEALQLARDEGIDIPALFSALKMSSADSWALRHFDSAGELPWSKKDMMIAMQIADRLNKPVPLTRLVSGLVRSSAYLGHAT